MFGPSPKIKRHVIGIKENKMSSVVYSDNPESSGGAADILANDAVEYDGVPGRQYDQGDRTKDVTQRELHEKPGQNATDRSSFSSYELADQARRGVQGTDLALRVPLAGRCTKYWQMRRSSRRHCSTAGWPVASEKKAARARQTQGSVRTALATGQL
jgi:hypothetical protein